MLGTSQKDSGNRRHRPKAKERQTKTRVTKENMTTVDELVGPLSQIGQMSKEMVLTQCSIVQITHRDLGLECLVRLPTRLLAIIVFFLHLYFTR